MLRLLGKPASYTNYTCLEQFMEYGQNKTFIDFFELGTSKGSSAAYQPEQILYEY